MHSVELTALDGSNMLAFLAALGTLRVLTLAEPGATVRLSWQDRGVWTPVIHHPRISSPDQLIDALEHLVCGEDTINPACKIAPNLTLSCEEFRIFLSQACDANCVKQSAFLVSFGSEFIGSDDKKEKMGNTELRAVGAGQQKFLSTMVDLARLTTSEHLRTSLLKSWTYSDPKPNLRWDPADYRPHALRAKDPQDDAIRTMRGANRLALEALPFFPTFPARQKLRTVSFDGHGSEPSLSWPVWTAPLNADTIASVMTLDVLQEPDKAKAEVLGIAQIFRAKRFTPPKEKYRNFSPSRTLL